MNVLLPGTHIPLACWDFDGRTFLETMYVTTTHFFINMLLIGEKSDATKYAADIQVIKTGVDCAPNVRNYFTTYFLFYISFIHRTT